MIRLFDSKETNFNHNKWVLSECINPVITETTDGIFDFECDYPLLDKKGISQYIVRGNIIKSPISETDTRGEQLFIIRTAKPNTRNRTISVYAQAYARAKLMTDFVFGFRIPSGKTRKEAVALLLSNCEENKNFTVGTLDTNTNTTINLGLDDNGNVINYLDIDYVSPLEGLLGEKQSIQNAYGGEIIFNNKEINFVNARGLDNTFTIESGKNLQELEQEISDLDSDLFATALIMCSSDGVYLPNKEVILSPKASLFDRKFYKKIVCDDVSLANNTTEALNVVYAQLRERGNKKFTDDGLDNIPVNNTVNFVLRQNTEEYKNFSVLEKCELGNNVTIQYTKANIEATGRVVKIKYNPNANNGKGKIIEVEIGEKKKNITNTINSISNKANDAANSANENSSKIKNLKVTMEENDNGILLEVRNNKTNTDAAIEVLDEQIINKVSKGSEFATEIVQNSNSVVTAIHGKSSNKVTIDSDGLTVTDGGFTYENTNGDTIIEAVSSGIRIGDSIWTTSQTKDRIYLGNSQLRDWLALSKLVIDSDLNMSFASNSKIYNVGRIESDYGEFFEDLYVDDTLYCESLEVNGGTKNCSIDTLSYGRRLLNAYETAEVYFGDVGEATIDETGKIIIKIDDIFKECVNLNEKYHFFYSCYNGSIQKIDRYSDRVEVFGEVGTVFSYEIKAKRIGFENTRLELSKNQK